MTLRLMMCACALLLLATGCEPSFRRRAQAPPAKHLLIEAKESADLTDREYLMRKATLGSRQERLEALDVIERAGDPEMLTFLLERLEKEDDRFLQIRIMHALAAAGDVRAVPPLRKMARWDPTRLGVEATAALYELGDDGFVPRLINRLRPDEENPEMAGVSYRALRKMTGADLPPKVRPWVNYYRSHRLAPYQSTAWFWPFRQPLPAHDPATGKVAVREKGKPKLPDQYLRIRRTNVTWQDFWRPDEP